MKLKILGLFVVILFAQTTNAQVGTLFYSQDSETGSMTSTSGTGAPITGSSSDLYIVNAWEDVSTVWFEFGIRSDCDSYDSPTNCIPENPQVTLYSNLGACFSYTLSEGERSTIVGEEYVYFSVEQNSGEINDCTGANTESFYIDFYGFANNFYFPNRKAHVPADSTDIFPYAKIWINGEPGPPEPTDVTTRIIEILEPRYGNITDTQNVLFEYTYYNGTTSVVSAYGELRDVTNGIQYLLLPIEPLASGENTYSATIADSTSGGELEAGNFYMWRPILFVGSSSPLIYGKWETFNVLIPSAGFTPDPAFWGNTDPWDINATNTLVTASTTCSGIEGVILENTCKIVAWLFIPPPFANDFVTDLVLKFYDTFPFNLLLVAKDTVFALNQFDWESYNPEEVSIMTLDFTNSSSTEQLGEIDLLSKTLLEEVIPSSFATPIRSTLEIAIFLSFIFALVMGVHKHFEN